MRYSSLRGVIGFPELPRWASGGMKEKGYLFWQVRKDFMAGKFLNTEIGPGPRPEQTRVVLRGIMRNQTE